MLVGNNLSKSYQGAAVLKDASVGVAAGDAMMLLGKNGSGKSTLINILAMSLKADSGTIQVDDLVGNAARAAIGFAPQDIALFEELSVEENLRCWCPLPAGSAGKRISELIERLGLTAERRKLLCKLSGGQKRRANLAAALAGEPRYLLLDEPLAGVDEESESRILELLSEYVKNGRGLLIAGHQPRLLKGLVNRVMVLERGETRFYGTADDYFANLEEREL